MPDDADRSEAALRDAMPALVRSIALTQQLMDGARGTYPEVEETCHNWISMMLAVVHAHGLGEAYARAAAALRRRGGGVMETETRLIVESVEYGVRSEIRTNTPVEQFAGVESVTMGTPGFEKTYRILSAETAPVKQPESPGDALDRVTATFWAEIQSILGAGNVKVQGWDDLLPEERAAIRSALRDAMDEMGDS